MILHQREPVILVKCVEKASEKRCASLDYFCARHSRQTKRKNAMSSIKYRRQSRRGSWASRNSHSNPESCIHRGARFKAPAVTSKLPPTPITKGTCISFFHL